LLFSSALASPGEPLDAATRAFMEPRLGFGTENYAIIRTATEAHVVVRIHLVEAARPHNTYDDPINIDLWRNGIASVWNGRFSLTNGATHEVTFIAVGARRWWPPAPPWAGNPPGAPSKR
jgi:hypothetical protein